MHELTYSDINSNSNALYFINQNQTLNFEHDTGLGIRPGYLSIHYEVKKLHSCVPFLTLFVLINHPRGRRPVDLEPNAITTN